MNCYLCVPSLLTSLLTFSCSENPEKIHFICIGQKIDDAETLNFNNFAIKNGKEVEILEITLDRRMNFHTHIKNICRKADQKLSALLRISLYLD